MMGNNSNNANIESLDVGIEPIETLDSNYTNVDNKVIVEKKKKLNFKVLLISMIFVVLIGLGVYYLLIINNPKTIFSKASNSFFESLEKVLSEVPNYLEKSYLYEGNVKINTNIEESNFLNNETFNYTLGLDIKNKKAEASFEIIDETNKLVAVDANIKDNSAYVDLNELFTKVILFDDQTITETTGMSINDFFAKLEDLYSEENIEDIKYIVTRFKEITNEALKKVNYEKISAKINVNGKNLNTNKMTLQFSKDNMQILSRTYIEEILNDNRLIEEIASLAEYDKKELTEMLNSAKEQIDTLEEPNSVLKLVVYTEGFFSKVVKVAIEENDIEQTYFINYDDYKLLAIGNTFIEIKGKELTIKELEELIMTGTVNSLDENNIDIDFVSVDNSFNGNIKYTFIDSDIDFKINIEINSFEKMKINFNIKTTSVSDSETEAKIVLGISFGSESFEVTNTTKMIVGASIASLNTNNKLNFKDMTESDMNTITRNLEARLKGTKYGELMGINGKSNFITDANSAIDASEQAMKLITIGSLSSNYTMENAITYCFTLQNLEDAGFISGYDDYEGTITVTKVGNDYSYRIEMHNDEYYVRTKDVVYEDYVYTTKYMPSTIKTKCINISSL